MKEMQIIRLGLSIIVIMLLALPMTAQKQHHVMVNGQPVNHHPRQPHNNTKVCPADPYRSIDGTCNNEKVDQQEWGATDIPLLRLMPAVYDSKDPWNAMNGKSRPSPRAISNNICAQASASESRQNLSAFVFTWGQFIDHDIDLTPEGHSEYVPIPLPEDETWFTGELPFFRSEVYPGTGESGDRQQTNLITSWIDGSNIYGSEPERADWLRTHFQGKLKMSTGGLLPYNTIDGELNSPLDPDAPSMAGDGGGTVKTFVSGDVRAAEQPGLTALHTLFTRQHNAICDRLVSQGMQDDETIYQEARKEVGALIQAITYQEFLPALGIRLSGPKGYNPSIRPDVSNLFATAAYRLGHTMVTSSLLLRDASCQPVGPGSIGLVAGFFNPQVIQTYGIDPILQGLGVQTQNEVDPYLVDELRNLLFGDPTSATATGVDLASLNIQRGRDHGLPDYNTVRGIFTGQKANDWNEITKDKNLQSGLKSMYASVDDIDLWVGLLAEDKPKNSSVGKTLEEILKKQFENLRDGDRFFYKYDKHFTKEQRDQIEATRLADIIEANTSAEFGSRDVFKANKCQPVAQQTKLEHRSNETGIDGILVYPNPLNDHINIRLPDYRGAMRLSIIDVEGRILKNVIWSNVTDGQLDLSTLHTGVYFLRVTGENTNESIRLLKVE
ncbi:MAG: peroxidase family protein [Saprospiraceae bacterium]